MGKQIIEGKIEKVFVKDFGEADQYGNQYGVNINIGGEWYGLGKKKKPVANVKRNGEWHQLAQGDVIEAVCETESVTVVPLKTSRRQTLQLRRSAVDLVVMGLVIAAIVVYLMPPPAA